MCSNNKEDKDIQDWKCNYNLIAFIRTQFNLSILSWNFVDTIFMMR